MVEKTMRIMCPRCKKWYSWNLDIGRTECPFCEGERLKEILRRIFGEEEEVSRLHDGKAEFYGKDKENLC